MSDSEKYHFNLFLRKNYGTVSFIFPQPWIALSTYLSLVSIYLPSSSNPNIIIISPFKYLVCKIWIFSGKRADSLSLRPEKFPLSISRKKIQDFKSWISKVQPATLTKFSTHSKFHFAYGHFEGFTVLKTHSLFSRISKQRNFGKNCNSNNSYLSPPPCGAYLLGWPENNLHMYVKVPLLKGGQTNGGRGMILFCKY